MRHCSGSDGAGQCLGAAPLPTVRAGLPGLLQGLLGCHSTSLPAPLSPEFSSRLSVFLPSAYSLSEHPYNLNKPGKMEHTCPLSTVGERQEPDPEHEDQGQSELSPVSKQPKSSVKKSLQSDGGAGILSVTHTEVGQPSACLGPRVLRKSLRCVGDLEPCGRCFLLQF